MSKTDKRRKTRSKSKSHSAVAAFLLKTYEILEDPTYNDIISWSDEGDAFIVKNVTEFSDKILPKYFKHNNFASFVRQLNMYDFHKTRHENNENEFRHKLFRRGQKHLLADIKRKTTELTSEYNQLVPMTRELDVDKFKKEASFFSNELKSLKGRQTDLEKMSKTIFAQNAKLLKENKLLWSELIKNKEKYERKIEKLMMFAFSVMQYSGNNPKAIEALGNQKSIESAAGSLNNIPDDKDFINVKLNDNDTVSVVNEKMDHEKFFKNLSKFLQSKGKKTNLDKLMELAKKGNFGDLLANRPDFTEDEPVSNLKIKDQDLLSSTHGLEKTRSRTRDKQKQILNNPTDDGLDEDLAQSLPSKFVKVESTESPILNLLRSPKPSLGKRLHLDPLSEPMNLDQSFEMNKAEGSPLHAPMYRNLDNTDFLDSPKPILSLAKNDMAPFRLMDDPLDLCLNQPVGDAMSLLSFPKPVGVSFMVKEEEDKDLGFGIKSDSGFEENMDMFNPNGFNRDLCGSTFNIVCLNCYINVYIATKKTSRKERKNFFGVITLPKLEEIVYMCIYALMVHCLHKSVLL